MFTLIERDGRYYVADAETKSPVDDGHDTIDAAAQALGAMMRAEREDEPVETEAETEEKAVDALEDTAPALVDIAPTGEPVIEVPVVVEDEPKLDSEQAEYTGGVISRVTRWFKGLGLGEKAGELPDGSYFRALGNRAWMAVHTNNFEDREDEILSDAAHEDYVARVEADKSLLPQLWSLHEPATKHGEALAVAKSGHFVYAVGLFDDTPLGRLMEKHYLSVQRKAKGLPVFGLSHGFTYPEWAFRKGVYDAYTTFEISVLPHSYAANPYTGFITLDHLEDKSMPLSDEQIKELGLVMPAEAIAYVKDQEARMLTGGKGLEALAKYKKFTAPDGKAKLKGSAPPPSTGDDEDDFEDDLEEDDDEAEKATGSKANAHLAQLVGDALAGQASLTEIVIGLGAAFGAQEARMAEIEAALALEPDAASESEATAFDEESEDFEEDEAMTADEAKRARQALAQRKSDEPYSRMAPGLFTR